MPRIFDNIGFFTDCRHVNKREVNGFPLDLETLTADQCESIQLLAKELSQSMADNSEFRRMRFSHDTLEVQCIIPKHSKAIIDQVDQFLARHFGFTDEELDFIINYDIKYRMGRHGAEEAESEEA